MTAAAPDSALRGLAREPRPPIAGRPTADGGDRIFVTLLSLNFMLLAFFVVLGTASSYDQPRAASVAKSVRIVFAAPDDEVPGGASPIRLTARQALQAGVSEAFAEVLPMAQRVTADDGDRVDVSLPADALAASGERTRDAMLDGIASLMRSAPPGIRYQLVLDGTAETATIADALMERGVLSRQLMIGSDGDETSALSFSFLLLEGDDDTAFTRLIAHGTP
jgi:hypothetical protein